MSALDQQLGLRMDSVSSFFFLDIYIPVLSFVSSCIIQ